MPFNWQPLPVDLSQVVEIQGNLKKQTAIFSRRVFMFWLLT